MALKCGIGFGHVDMARLGKSMSRRSSPKVKVGRQKIEEHI